MKRGWKGGLIGGVVGFVYSIISIYYSFVSGFIGYSCPIKIDSWVSFIFYPTISLTCLSFFENMGMIGFFVYSILVVVVFTFIGVFLGRFILNSKVVEKK